MKKIQSPILTDMVSRLNAFRDGSFGIDRRDSSAPWVLCANRQIFPLERLRLALWDQDGLQICDLQELPEAHSLIFDEAGKSPAACRLAYINKADQSILALADDASPITGYLFVSVRPQGVDAQPWAISALFNGGNGHQESGLLWHDDPELVRFLGLQEILFERRRLSNAQQLQAEAFSGAFEFLA